MTPVWTGWIVATVAGQPITVAQMEDRMRSIRRGPLAQRLPDDDSQEALRVRRWVVQLLVTEAVVTHEAAGAGIAAPASGAAHRTEAPTATTASGADPTGVAPPITEIANLTTNGADPSTARQLMRAVRGLFERVTADVTVPEAEVRSYYDRNADRYTRPEARRIRHVLCPDESAAHAAVIWITAGEAMVDPPGARSSARVGAAGHRDVVEDVRRGEFTGAFEDAVFSAVPGEVVGPAETELGWHVARVEEITPAGVVPYAQVRPEIEADLLSAARGKVFDEWLEQRRQALTVFDPYWVHPGDPALPDHVHRH